MASVERIQGEVEGARKRFLEADRKVNSQAPNVGGAVATLRGLLFALEETGAIGQGEMDSKEYLDKALAAGSDAQEEAAHGLQQLRTVTSGAESETATTMVRAAAKTHSQLVERQARLTMADEALGRLVEPITLLRDAVMGVVGQLAPELYNGENGLEIRQTLHEADDAISNYSNTL